ncbi:MAG: hypothetical protein CNLJKLNK_00430 [Holosporales bacterium]
MFYYGEGTPKNLEQAFQYFKLAADQGCTVSQNQCGKMLQNGEGVEKNLTQASHYFKLAADQGTTNFLSGLTRFLGFT